MKHIAEQLIIDALTLLKVQEKVPADVNLALIKVDKTKDNSHGDYATNIALLIAKSCQQPPRQVAEWIIEALRPHDALKKVEIAGPGFINFFMKNGAFTQIVPVILAQKERFGSSSFGRGQKVLVEFVSSNPTGPLHVGHGRSAAFGASLCNILSISGYEVSREYYVNDAGRQMNILALSVWLRYLSLLGEPITFPINAYKGDYVIDIAQVCKEKYAVDYVRPWEDIKNGLPLDECDGGDKEAYVDALIQRARELIGAEAFKCFHQAALHSVLADIKEDLARFGVSFDCWFSEQTLIEEGNIEKGIQALKEGGHTYIKGEALWFKATDFGDEKDRVLVRANGQSTYFASDVAYHWNKYERGYDRVIDIFGSDHHGYVSRIRAAVTALGHDERALSVFLVQFAILYRGETRVQMSTRSGSFVTLRELQDEVGTDCARFFYVMRKAEQHMDFDLDLAKSESNDNPVYYIQYAHARICSVFRQMRDRGLDFDEAIGLSHLDTLTQPQELHLLAELNQYGDTVQMAAKMGEPHLVAYYLRALANALHSYYNAIQLLCEDPLERHARLCLLKATAQTIKNGLQLLGVSAPESM